MTAASRWERVTPFLPYLFIVLPAAASLLDNWQPAVLGLSVLAVVAYWAVNRWQARHPAIVFVYFVGMLAVLGLLVGLDEVFTVSAVGVFVQAFTLLPGWWAYAGVAATAGVVVACRPRDGESVRESVFSFLIAVLIASAVGFLFHLIAEQSEQRRQLIGRLEALADENAELQAQLLTRAREAGILGERQRMARELHDTIAQNLTAIVTQLEVADTVLDDAPAARTRLETARSLAREGLGEARRSIHALRPAVLDQAQLPRALEDIAGNWSRSTGVSATVTVTGEVRPLHSEVEITLLRVAQEGLANIAKHADATRVAVTLSYMEDVVALDLRDDGKGFVAGASGRLALRGGGFGLVAMRQRVNRLAGTLEIETAPGDGTGISATVPAIPADALRTARTGE
jgi:signal transduction histidine kinase